MADFKGLVVCASSGIEIKNFKENTFPKDWEYLCIGGTMSVSSYDFKLDTIDYDKRVFSPCLFSLHFSVMKNSAPESLGKVLKENFLLKECELFVTGNKDSDGLYEKLDIAESYFIHSFKMQNDGTKTACVFNCFSIDKKISVKKASEAFTAKKFGEGIFKSQLERDPDMKDKYEFDCANLLMLGFDGYKLCRDGHHYKKNENGEYEKDSDGNLIEEFGHDVELIHPYIVRYNESLYDFLARVAHKCGEFLYFEKGMLRLGLPEDTRKALISDGDCKTFTTSPICSYPNSSVSGGVQCATGFSADYAAGIQEVESSGTYFDIQHTSDDHLYNVNEDDNLDGISDFWMLINALSTIFTSKHIFEGVIKALVELGCSFVFSEGVIPERLRNEFEQYLGEENAFSTSLSSDARNLCNSFFHNVETLEKRSELEKVTMNFSSTYPHLLLCSAVCPGTESSRYVVTRVYGTFASSNSSGTICHYAEGVPFRTDITIDSLPAVAVPPRGNIPHRIVSGPKEAIVEKNDDPLRLGRVRIRYPWQTSDDTQISPWLRVPVAFAGNADDGGGFTMTPACGEHVIVDYLKGDIERPYVDGSYYFRYGDKGSESHNPSKGPVVNTKRTMLPTAVPQAIVSGNGHYIAFPGRPDSSLLQQLIPLLDAILKVCGVQSTALPIKGGGVVMADGSELCKISLDGERRSVTIASNWGTVEMSAFTGISVSAPNGNVVIRGKNVSIAAGNNLILKSGANIKQKKEKVGDVIASSISALVAQLTIGMVSSFTGIDLSGCLDLTSLRCILEIILRPVEGTLTLQSGRNVLFTAGEGTVTVPGSCLSGEDKTPAGRVNNAIKKASDIIDDYYADARKLFDAMCAAASDYKTCYENGNPTGGTVLFEGGFISKDGFKPGKVKETAAKGDPFPKKDEVVKIQPVPSGSSGASGGGGGAAGPVVPPGTVRNDNDKKEKAYKALSDAYKKLCNAVKAYLEHVGNGKLKEVLDPKFKKFKSSGKYVVVCDNFPDNYKQSCEKSDQPEDLLNSCLAGEENIAKRKTIMKRSAIIQIILSVGEYVKFVRHKGSATFVPGQLSEYGESPQDIQYAGDSDLSTLNGIADGTSLSSSSTSTWENLVKSIATCLLPKDTSTASSGWLSGVVSCLGVFTGGGYNTDTGQWSVAPSIMGIINHNGEAGPRAFSEMSSGGSILFSDTKGKTLRCTNDYEWDSMQSGDAFGIAQHVKELNLNI